MAEDPQYTVNRFVEALVTGKRLLSKYEETFTGKENRCHTISCSGIGLLVRNQVLHEAFRAASKLEHVHPKAQHKFLKDVWTRVEIAGTRRTVNDDDVFIDAIWKLLPPYEGGPIELWRGQEEDDPIGLSWTRSFHIGINFMMYRGGMQSFGGKLREKGVLLRTLAQPHAIISAPCLLGHKEGEYVVDPRRIEVEVHSRSRP